MVEDIILKCEAELRNAMLTNDVVTLDRLIDDALIFTTLEGAIISKQDDLAAHRAKRLRLNKLEPSEQRIICLPNTAIVSVRMDVAGTFDGATIGGALRYTRVWCERGGHWRLLAGHMSAVYGDGQ